MKRIVLSLILLLTILFGGVNGSFAEDNYKWQPVFKIYNYTYDRQNELYVLQSYWSAVYLWNKTILTNNHVVENFTWWYDWYYEICETKDFTKRPVCFSSARLMYTDKTKDLAILKLNIEPSIDKKIEFSTKKITIWDKIETYGYPSNWWETVTFTSGKISGFDSGKYKIDANVDSWSSWWGAFDNDWKLVWITTSVVSWYTTLGYLVPVWDLKEFIIQKWNIVNYKSINLNSFNVFLKKYQSRILSNEIINDYIELKNISQYGFSIYENIFDEKEEINKFFLESKTWYTNVSIFYDLENWIESNITEEDYAKIRKLFDIRNNIAQEIFYKNEDYNYDFTLNEETKEIKITFEKNNVVYRIEWSIDKKDEVKDAILMFFKNAKVKNIKKFSKNIFIDWLRIDQKSNFTITKSLDNNNQLQFIWIKKIKSTLLTISGKIISFTKPEKYKNEGLKSFMESYKKRFSWKWVYSDLFVDQKGVLYSYVKSNNWKIISYNFEVVRELEWQIYSYNFIVIVHWGDYIDSHLKTFFNNIDFEWKWIFTDEEIRNVNLKKLYEINFLNKDLDIKKINPTFETKYTKQYAFEFLEKVSWIKWDFSNGTNKKSYKSLLLQTRKDLLKTKHWKKYIIQFDILIPKLKTIKLKKVSKKLEKLNLNSSKLRRYKLILEYIKYGILVELEKR